MRVILLAAGPGTRWGGHMGGPKHLVPVDGGEPLLHRTVRQLHERGCSDVWVSGPAGDARYQLPGTQLFLPVVSEEDPADKYANSRELWSSTERTLVLYGDTFYTDEALGRILADDSHELRLAYCYRNPTTGHRWGGCAAMWWWPEQAPALEEAIAEARSRWLAGKLRTGTHSGGKRIEVGPWHILTIYLGLERVVQAADAQKSRLRLPQVLQLRDWTADFDWPSEYDGWQERRVAYLARQAPEPARFRARRAAREATTGQPQRGHPSLSILVPFRDADGARTPAMEWVVARWRYWWPEAELIVGTDDGVDPFNKSMAVNDAASRATGQYLAILDADTWMDPERFRAAFDKVASGLVPWCRPAGHALRLRREMSERLLRLKPHEKLPPIMGIHAETSSPVVGFLWLVPRAGFERMGGMDERVRGWGGEDSMFVLAADKVMGHGRSFTSTLMSLWHPRPRDERNMRIWVGQDRKLNEGAKGALLKQYRRASGAEGMLRVLAEAGGPLRGGWAS